MFPVFGMIYHEQLKYVHNKKELRTFFVLKTLVFVAFILLACYTWITQTELFQSVTCISLMAIPAISIIYSYIIFNAKCMTVNQFSRQQAAGVNAANGNQPGRRMADAAELDERQEVAIREFQERRQNMQVNFDNRNFRLGLAEAGQDLVEMSEEISNR